MKRGGIFAGVLAAASTFAGAAFAAENETLGQPTPRAIDLQPAATGVMQDIHDFHAFILPIVVAISVFVLALLLWVMVRYNRRANPTPRKFTHNMLVEVIWTIVPVLILVVIAWKSFPLIFKEEQIPPNAELTLKVTGNSWFWNYEYPDLHVTLTQNPLTEDEVNQWNAAHPNEQPKVYLLATNNVLYVPSDTTVRVLITSNDVIHSFAVPAFGIKEDAIQGRVNDTWFRVDSHLTGPGSHTYYGECSELCGVNHSFMPIEVRSVPRAEFYQWVVAQGGTIPGQQPAAPAAPGAAAPAAATTPTR
ncbi:MAG TPA: cytochrome c oxidase subunit II [Vitreimonas sp.]|nr:cytochrome c oxidase subunit II [Vitreimonas sp.]